MRFKNHFGTIHENEINDSFWYDTNEIENKIHFDTTLTKMRYRIHFGTILMKMRCKIHFGTILMKRRHRIYFGTTLIKMRYRVHFCTMLMKVSIHFHEDSFWHHSDEIKTKPSLCIVLYI